LIPLNLKILKYYISRLRIFRYLRVLFKFLIIERNLDIFLKKKRIKYLGNFSININFFNIDEVLSLNEDLDYVQGFRYFINKETKIYIHSSHSNLIYNFFSSTLNCTTIVLKENFIQNYNKNKNLKVVNSKDFFNLINQDKNKNSILICEKKLDTEILINLDKFSYFFLKYKDFYLNKKIIEYYYDFFGKITSKITPHKKFYLYSRHVLIKKKTSCGITGLACLKNLDLYPFDICFESALNIVDEMIIGVDEDSYNKNKKYQILLKKFLQQTKFKRKIKIYIFNFFSNTANNCKTRGRWIADVFNKLMNSSKNKHVMICGADELFDFNLKKKLSKKFLFDYDEIVLRFYHFIFSFKFIRDPNHASYNFWNRIVKTKNYISNGDGMGFIKNNAPYPKIKVLNEPVYHIGYIVNYKKKIKTHLNQKNGVFGNKWNLKKYMKMMKPIKSDKAIYNSLKKNIYKYKYMNGFKLVKKFLHNEIDV